MLGTAAVKAINWAVTEAVYGRSARKFARRHARAGGTALPLRAVLGRAGELLRGRAHRGPAAVVRRPADLGRGGLLAGASWEDINAQGRALRALWARFASGKGLERRGGIPGALRYRSV